MSSPAPSSPEQPKRGFWRVFGRVLKFPFTVVAVVLAFCFGRIRWKYEGPWWLSKGIPGLARWTGNALKRWVTLTSGAWWLRGIKAVTLVLAVGLVGLGLFEVFQDRSAWTKVEVAAPKPTPLEKDATYSVLKLTFSSSAASAELADKTVGEGVTLTPAVKGSWKWQGDDELVFSPSEDWTSDTDYTVTLTPTLFRDGLKLDRAAVGFHTEPFRASLSDARFEVDPENEQDRRVRATLVFNYPVDPASLKDRVEIKVTGSRPLGELKTIDVEVTFDEFQGKAFIKSQRLPVPKDRTEVTISVRGGIQAKTGRALGGDQSVAVAVPGLFDKVKYSGLEPAVVRNDNYVYEQTLTLDLTGEAAPAKIGAAIQLWLLPLDRVGVAGLPDEKRHFWGVQEVDSALLAKSIKLQPVLLPTENDTATLFSFKYKAPAGRLVYAEFAGNTEAFGGYIIKDPLRSVVQVPAIPRSLEIMHTGSLLSLNGDKTISVVSNDVRTVRFRTSRLFPDQVNHLITQTDGSFSEPYFRDTSLFSELDMSTVYQEVRDLPIKAPGAVQYQSFSFANYLAHPTNSQEKYGLFLFNVSEYDRSQKSEFGESSRRFILVTDLGLLAKRNSDGSYEVFVQDIRTGRPRAGVSVDVLGRNGVSIFGAETDAQGRVHVPMLSGMVKEKAPVVFTARSGADLSFLPIDREDRFVDYSRFDVGGEEGATDPERVTAFLFSDRGLYRPGDAIHVGYIVKAGDWTRKLAGLPLEMKIYDPRGLEVQKTLVKLPPSGFDEARYSTFDTSTTGTWRFELAVVKDDKSREFLGSTSVRVEEFTPDRLTISSRLVGADERAWIPFSSLQASVHLANLYGTAAAANPVNASFRLIPQALSFPQYPDYRFDDAFSTDKFHEESLPAGVTDANGDANFSLNLDKFEPATFQVVFSVEGLEKQGGRGVAAESTVVVSPLEWILGWKSDGKLDYVPKGAVRNLQFLAINSQRKAVPASGLKYQVDEVRYLSVLTKKEDGSYQYQSVRKKFPVTSGAFDVAAAGRSWTLDTSSPGDFEFSVLDNAGRTVARSAYTVVGKGNLTRSLDRNAELEVKLDKEDYDVGEQIELQIKAPYAGSGIITIEREHVYSTQWFTTDTNASIQHITVPEGLEGNAYVNVSFIRASDSPEIYMSPLSYGVVPFRVSISKRSIDLKVSTVDEAKPGQPFTIKYRADRPSKVVIYAVDEGILQVAHYQTPKPLQFFFKKRALEVSTSQILDMILPEFSVVRDVMAMGGDGEALRARQNPFQRKQHAPVAYWSGVIDAGTDERSVTYDIPSYFNGTLRIMAVAVSDDAIGVTQKKALIRNDFIVSPSLPSFVAPGDEFLVGVTVANNAPTGTKGPIILTVKGDGSVGIIGDAKKSLNIEKGSEQTAWIRLKAGPSPGAARLTFTASAGTLSAELEEELSIRPAVVWTEKIDSGILSGGSTKVALPRRLLPDLRKLKLSLSFRPASLDTGLLGYLSDYPYGCTEQILSKAFPAMLLLSDPDAGVDKAKTENSIAEAIKVLGYRQNDEGGIGLWSASDEADDFVTVYAAHFLTEAASRGYTAGDSIRRAIIGYLGDHLADSDIIAGEPQVAAYAAWVLALNGRVSTSLVLDVRNALDKGTKDPALLYLAGASALLKQQAEADRLLDEYGDGSTVGDEVYYDSDLYRQALRVYMNARYRSKNFGENNRALESMIGLIGKNRFSTLSSAWAVLAFQAYGDRAPQVTPETVIAVGKTRAGKDVPLAITSGRIATIDYPSDLASVTITDKGGAPLYWQAVQSGFDDTPPAKPSAEGIEVYREYQDAAGKTVTTAQRGQTLTAVLKIRSTGKPVENVAIVDLLPGGLELALDSQSNRPFAELLQGSMDKVAAEGREDRLIVFGTAASKLTEVRYPVKAVTAGTFVVPAATAEGMYDRNLRGNTAAGTFIVTE